MEYLSAFIYFHIKVFYILNTQQCEAKYGQNVKFTIKGFYRFDLRLFSHVNQGFFDRIFCQGGNC